MEKETLEPIKTILIYLNKSAEQGEPKFYVETSEMKLSPCKTYYQPDKHRPAMVSDLQILNNILYDSDNMKNRIVSTYTEVVFKANWNEIMNHGISKDSLDIWWASEPQKIKMFFSKKNSIKTGSYNMPGLVWNYKNRQLYVYAVKSKINAHMQMFRAPLLNVSSTGLVCLGSTKIEINKSSNSLDVIAKDIEKSFFNSEFTHINDSNPTLKPVETAYDIAKEGEFPLDHLAPMNTDLKTLCTR